MVESKIYIGLSSYNDYGFDRTLLFDKDMENLLGNEVILGNPYLNIESIYVSDLCKHIDNIKIDLEPGTYKQYIYNGYLITKNIPKGLVSDMEIYLSKESVENNIRSLKERSICRWECDYLPISEFKSIASRQEFYEFYVSLPNNTVLKVDIDKRFIRREKKKLSSDHRVLQDYLIIGDLDTALYLVTVENYTGEPMPCGYSFWSHYHNYLAHIEGGSRFVVRELRKPGLCRYVPYKFRRYYSKEEAYQILEQVKIYEKYKLWEDKY